MLMTEDGMQGIAMKMCYECQMTQSAGRRHESTTNMVGADRTVDASPGV